MRAPVNPIAETIVSLEEENVSLARQIEMLTNKIAQNEASLVALEPLAEWEEIPDAEQIA